MGAESKIEWTDHTASPWHGCTKVHSGCNNCYAETMSLRNPNTLGVWGRDGLRVKSKSFISNLRKWNAHGEKIGRVQSVFPSICDPFEDRQELIPWRDEMFAAIDELPWVRLLLLTKRPENIRRMWPQHQGTTVASFESFPDKPRNNVWLGTSISLQEHADKQIPELLKCRNLAPVLFLSIEPLLGPINFRWASWKPLSHTQSTWELDGLRLIDWIIVGGESGHNARPMHPDWVRLIRDQCKSAGVPFFFKQWGEWSPGVHRDPKWRDALVGIDGGLLNQSTKDAVAMTQLGKKAAGRILDGREWSDFPALQTV